MVRSDERKSYMAAEYEIPYAIYLMVPVSARQSRNQLGHAGRTSAPAQKPEGIICPPLTAPRPAQPSMVCGCRGLRLHGQACWHRTWPRGIRRGPLRRRCRDPGPFSARFPIHAQRCIRGCRLFAVGHGSRDLWINGSSWAPGDGKSQEPRGEGPALFIRGEGRALFIIHCCW